MRQKQSIHPLILSHTLLVFPHTAVTFTSKETLFGKKIKEYALQGQEFILSLPQEKVNFVSLEEEGKIPNKISLLAKAKYLEKTNQIYLEGLRRVHIEKLEQSETNPYEIMAAHSSLKEEEEVIPLTHHLNYARIKRYYKNYVEVKIENPITRMELLQNISRPEFVIHSLANLLLLYPKIQQEILERNSWIQRVNILHDQMEKLPSTHVSAPPKNKNKK